MFRFISMDTIYESTYQIESYKIVIFNEKGLVLSK